MSGRKLTPEFKERVWGATSLEPWFPNPFSISRASGRSLEHPAKEHSAKKVGEVWFDAGPGTPLIKFLFTTEKLSVQVHPEDDYAARHHNSPGKTEMWHVLAAGPGAKIVAGFREEITRERAEAAAKSGEIEDMLQEFTARAGDTFFIPAGTVHAIGAGLTICEIQQRSDVTYRLYDYGRPRELHLDHGMSVSNLRPHAARCSLPVICSYFHTNLLEVRDGWTAPDDRGRILVVLSGTTFVSFGTTGDRTSLVPGEVWYSPPHTLPVTLTGETRAIEVVF